MNKTVTINLAGMLFHIDENAFLKLQNYLSILKKAYANEIGSDEIIADIEARIAELFNDLKFHDLQVIDLKNVDEIIGIMGQPEDLFEDDEDPIDDQKKQEEKTETNTHKKPLFRDSSEAYISGTSSGLSHYFEVSAIWVRLAWVCLVLFSGGAFILLYVALWFFVPKANTTAEKLAMKGKSVNVNTIEEKIKESFNSVADTMKNAYHKTNGDNIKNKSVIVVSKLEQFLGQFFKIAGRLLGICLMLFSGLGIITVFVSFLGFNIMNITNSFWFDYSDLIEFISPLWLSSILISLTITIPLFFIFILGLKISFPKIKKVGKTVILSLIGAWLLSIIAFFSFQLANKKLNIATASTSTEEIINIANTDTLNVFMTKDDRYIDRFNSNDDFLIKETIDGQQILVFRDLKIYVQTTQNEAPYMIIKKQAKGPSYNEALALAEKINFKYRIKNNNLFIDGYALGNYDDKYRRQKVKLFLMLPEGMTLFADNSTSDYNNHRKPNKFAIIRNKENHYLKLKNGNAICSDCKDDNVAKNKLTINIGKDFDNELEERIKAIIQNSLDEDKNELNFNGKKFNVKIDDHGIEINNIEE